MGEADILSDVERSPVTGEWYVWYLDYKGRRRVATGPSPSAALAYARQETAPDKERATFLAAAAFAGITVEKPTFSSPNPDDER